MKTASKEDKGPSRAFHNGYDYNMSLTRQRCQSRYMKPRETNFISIAAQTVIQMFFFAGGIALAIDSTIFNCSIICYDLRNTSLLLQVHFVLELKYFGGQERGEYHWACLSSELWEIWREISGDWPWIILFYFSSLKEKEHPDCLPIWDLVPLARWLLIHEAASQLHTSLEENLTDIEVLQPNSYALVLLPAFLHSPHLGPETRAASSSLSSNVSPVIK